MENTNICLNCLNRLVNSLKCSKHGDIEIYKSCSDFFRSYVIDKDSMPCGRCKLYVFNKKKSVWECTYIGRELHSIDDFCNMKGFME